MDLNINITYGEKSIENLAFVKALLIKSNIENLDLDYKQKEELLKRTLKQLEKNTK